MNDLESLYRQVIMDHYKNPRNKGLKNEEGYKQIHIKNPSCGDDVTIETKCDGQRVIDVRHDGTGCSICCSSASVLSEMMIGKNIEDAKKVSINYLNMITNKEVDETVDLEEAAVYEGVKKYPARVKCASIAWRAFLESIGGEHHEWKRKSRENSWWL